MNKRDLLKGIRLDLDVMEEARLSPYACLSSQAVRRKEEDSILMGHRQNFSLDADRILHDHSVHPSGSLSLIAPMAATWVGSQTVSPGIGRR